MGRPLGLASEHPGLGRCFFCKKRCPITHPALAANHQVRAEAIPAIGAEPK